MLGDTSCAPAVLPNSCTRMWYIVAMKAQHPVCPDCGSQNVEQNCAVVFDSEELDYDCLDCGSEFAVTNSNQIPPRKTQYCPECGSGATEPDVENPGKYWCDECGHVFTPRIRNKPTLASKDESARKLFQEKCGDFGLDPSVLGRVVKHEGSEFELIGLNPRATRRPFVFRKRTDPTLRLSADAVWLCKKLGITRPPHDLNDQASIAKRELEKRGRQYGLSPELAGRIVTIGGRRLRILGLRPRVRTQHVSLQCVDSGSYRKCSVEVLNRALFTMESPAPAPTSL